MPSVIRLVGLISGQPHPFDGAYVVEYDPSPAYLPPRECVLRVTTDKTRAKQYVDNRAAFNEVHRVDKRNPIRADGRLNKPLTAFNISIERID